MEEVLQHQRETSTSRRKRRCFSIFFKHPDDDDETDDAECLESALLVGGGVLGEEAAPPPTPTKPPRGATVVVGVSIGVIGCASLFAWNAIITASAYFGKRFCGSLIARDYESVFSVTYQLTSVAATLYAARVTEEMSAEERVVPRLKGLAWIFFTFTLLACWPSAPRDAVFVPLSLLGTALAGASSQALCSALYGIATALPSTFMSWNMAGQAVGGLIPAIIVVVEDLAAATRQKNARGHSGGSHHSGGDKDPQDDDDDDGCKDKGVLDLSAVGYFASACFLFLLSIAAFRVLEKTALYKAAISDPADRRALQRRGGSNDHDESYYVPPDLDDDDPIFDDSEEDDDHRQNGGSAMMLPSSSSSSSAVSRHHQRRRFCRVADFALLYELSRMVAVPAAAVFAVFCVTLSVFPTLTALARPKGHAADDDGSGDVFRQLYVPVLFLLFNLGDFVGRSVAPRFAASAKKPGLLLALAVLRVGFVPLILYGTLDGSRVDGGPAFLKHTAAPIVVIVPFAVSNGLVATLAMAAAAPLSPKRHKELVGNVMSFFLSFGLASGSFLSFAMLAIVDHGKSRGDDNGE